MDRRFEVRKREMLAECEVAPESFMCVRAFVVPPSGGHAAVLKTTFTNVTVWSLLSHRSRSSMCKRNIGSPRNLGGPVTSTSTTAIGVAVNSKLQAGKPRIRLAGANRIQVWYRRAKENVAERNGRQEVIVS